MSDDYLFNKNAPQLSSNITRADGMQIPQALIAALETCALADNVKAGRETLLNEEVRVISYAPYPVLWTDEESEDGKIKVRQTPEDIESYNNACLKLYEIQRRDACKNCGGLKGRGKLYTFTGEVNLATLNKSRFRRGLQSWDCPVCSTGNHTADLLNKSGIADKMKFSRTSDFYWWGKIVERAEFEEAIRGVVESAARYNLGGWLTVVGTNDGGKTTLLEWATISLCMLGASALYLTALDFEAGVRGWDFEDDTPPIVARAMSAPYLLFDQIGWIQDTTAAGNDTQPARWLRYVLDNRYSQINSKATVMVWNTDKWNKAQDSVGPLRDIRSRAIGGKLIIIDKDIPIRRAIGEGKQ